MEINSLPVSVGPLRLASDRTEIISSFALPSSIHIKSDFSPTAHLRGIATDWSRILISSIDQPTIVVISMLNASTSTLRVAVFFFGEKRERRNFYRRMEKKKFPASSLMESRVGVSWWDDKLRFSINQN